MRFLLDMLTGGARGEGESQRTLGFLLVAGTLLAGCVGPHTTLQTAQTVQPGNIELIGGASVPIHGAFSRSLLNNVTNATRRAATDPGAPLSDAEKSAAVEAALAAILLQASVVPELSLRVGVIERLDVGLRYGGPNWKLDAKFQFLDGTDFDGALSVGYVYHTRLGARIASSVFTLFDMLRLVDYSRHDLDAAVLISSKPRHLLSVYGALRYILGRSRFDISFPSRVVEEDSGLRSAPASTLQYFLGTGGLRVGTDRLGLLLEFSAGWSHFAPTVFGEARQLSGVVVSPAAGIDVTF